VSSDFHVLILLVYLIFTVTKRGNTEESKPSERNALSILVPKSYATQKDGRTNKAARNYKDAFWRKVSIYCGESVGFSLRVLLALVYKDTIFNFAASQMSLEFGMI
jgi:hypothetical protein